MPKAPSTNNYTVGKGVLSIATWSGGSIGAYEDMGNCTSFEVEPTLERLPHYSSREQFREKDKNPVIQTEYAVTFTLDEPSAENMTKFLLGLQSGQSIYAMQATNEEFALRFVSNNPIGPNRTWNFWKVTLSPAGPMQLIGDDWMVMEYTGEGLADRGGHPTSPYITVQLIEATSTTTTTTTV